MQDIILVLGRELPLMNLIARTLRGQRIYARPLALDTPLDTVLSYQPKGVILAAEGENAALPDGALFASGIPVLVLGNLVSDLCLHFGGKVEAPLPDGQGVTFGCSDSPLFSEITGGERMLQNLNCLTLPETLESLATATERCIGFIHREQPVYALQYPIEPNDPDGAQLLYNFAQQICGAETTWTDDAIIQQAVDLIREIAGDGPVFCAVSGGVDSAVCAKLAHMAAGDRLDCFFIDTGFFRQNEPEEILRSFEESLGISVRYLDEKARFMAELNGIEHRSEKERLSVALLNQRMLEQRAKEAHTLVLGANLNDILFSDSAESGSAAGDEPRGESRVVRPLLNLFKEEVRRLAIALSLPQDIVSRQPFPAGGLALRVLGQVTEEKLQTLRMADACFQEEICEAGQEKRLWQFFASLLELPETLDGGRVISLRAQQGAQGGAYAARLPYDMLERVTARILEEVPDIDRVIYDLTPSTRYREQD